MGLDLKCLVEGIADSMAFKGLELTSQEVLEMGPQIMDGIARRLTQLGYRIQHYPQGARNARHYARALQ